MEVLVSLGILLALAGLALPSLTNWSSRHADGAMADELQSALDVARSVAMENAVVVSVGVERTADGAQVVMARWERSAATEQEEASESRRALVVMGGAYELERAADDERKADGPDEREDARADSKTSEPAFVVWTVLPDGTVRSGEAVVLRAADGRRGAVAAAAWSGALAVAPLTLPEPDAVPKDDEPDEEPEAPSAGGDESSGAAGKEDPS